MTPALEIHVHGDIALQPESTQQELQEALRPLWSYSGSPSFEQGQHSLFADEPGMRLDHESQILHLCWSVAGDENFRFAMDEVCMNLNELALFGAAIEVTYYDVAFNESDEEPSEEDFENSRDDFTVYFVGPNPAAIMAVQRDLLVRDVVDLMERHFEEGELTGVVGEIDKLFTDRFNSLVHSLEIDRPPTLRSTSPRNTSRNKARRQR